MRTQNETHMIELNKLNFRKEGLKRSSGFDHKTRATLPWVYLSFHIVLDQNDLLNFLRL